MSKVLAITLYRRPAYTAQLFQALQRCYGIEEYHILISCDMSDEHRSDCDIVVEQAYNFQTRGIAPTYIFINDPRLGVDKNKLFLLPKAFEHGDYVIFLEDDTPIAQDGLRYFEAMNRMFKDDASVLSVTGYNRYLAETEHQRVLAEESYALDRGQGFVPWGWAMWKDRYEKFMGDGSAYAERWGEEVNGRFDWWFTEAAKTQEIFSVYPVMPRTQHVGGENAEHTPSQQWLIENEFNPYGAWSQLMPDPAPDLWRPKW